MRFWIFKCNPDSYKLADRLASQISSITWLVTRFKDEISPGDTAFVWRTGDDRGIVAVLNIDSAPHEMEEVESEKPFCIDLSVGIQRRVLATITDRSANLGYKELRSTMGLENLSVLQGGLVQKNTNFAVTQDEGEILMNLIRRATSQTVDHSNRNSISSPIPF